MAQTPLQRIRTGAKPWQFVYWWVARLCFIYGFICTIFWSIFPQSPPSFTTLVTDPNQTSQVTPSKLLLMMIIYLPVCFIWEIVQFFPEKNVFRQMSSYVQNLTIPFALSTGFFGAFVNFYYTVWWWDDVIHCIGGALCAMLGYELCVAMQRKGKQAAPLSIVLLAAAGMSFIIGTGWELFEFTFDQITPGGDTQHWSYLLAQEANQVRPFFSPGPGSPDDALSIFRQRFALMDTMSDIFLNAVGAVAFSLWLRLRPYHHRGPNNPNVLFARRESSKEEIVQAVSEKN